MKKESITFEVEKGLEKPREYFDTYSIKYILNKLYRKKKKFLTKDGKEIFFGQYEPLEILHCTFDTQKQEIYNFQKKSLIQGLITAYKNHYPITITPDMIWLLILQGFSRFMEKFGNTVRDKFVNFGDKKDLKVERLEYTPYDATKEVWDGIIGEYVQKIGENVGKEVVQNLECNFSTTNPITKVTSQVTIMSSMKDFFEYKLLMAGCGISSITLEGSEEDWKKIKSKLEFLSHKGLHWWTQHLIPIINNILYTKKYYSYKNKLSDYLISFWKGMIRLRRRGMEHYDPHMINGWIIKFIPNLENEKPTLYKEINETDVPDQIINCPLELTWLILPLKKKIDFKCTLVSGFFGMDQDQNSFNVRPVIGYAIVVNDKKESNVSDEEINSKIKEFIQ